MEFLSGMSIADDWQLVAHDSKKANVVDLKAIHAELVITHIKYQSAIEKYADALSPSPLSDVNKKILIDYYESPPEGLKRLIQRRRNEHGLECCPYCGNPFAPDTLDHFVPKDDWPEYSFLPNNLVPQCRGCAPIKGSAYYCSDSNACFFIHPIYSELLSSVSIKVMISFNAVDARPNFDVRFYLDKAGAEGVDRIKRHLKKVKVKSRVLDYCTKEFNRLKRQLTKRHYDISAFLMVSVEAVMPVDGSAKDWKTALYQAILNDQKSIEYLHSFRPLAEKSAVLGGLVEVDL